MPVVQLRWHNLNIGFRLSINTGAALLLWVGCFFLLIHMASSSEAVERMFPTALAGLTGTFITFTIKRHNNNKLDSQERMACDCDMKPKKNSFTSVKK